MSPPDHHKQETTTTTRLYAKSSSVSSSSFLVLGGSVVVSSLTFCSFASLHHFANILGCVLLISINNLVLSLIVLIKTNSTGIEDTNPLGGDEFQSEGNKKHRGANEDASTPLRALDGDCTNQI